MIYVSTNERTARGLETIEGVDVVKADSFPGLVALVKYSNIDFVVHGPEAICRFRKGRYNTCTRLTCKSQDFRWKISGLTKHPNCRVSQSQGLLACEVASWNFLEAFV